MLPEGRVQDQWPRSAISEGARLLVHDRQGHRVPYDRQGGLQGPREGRPEVQGPVHELVLEQGPLLPGPEAKEARGEVSMRILHDQRGVPRGIPPRSSSVSSWTDTTLSPRRASASS
jgi:hypothetical protein